MLIWKDNRWNGRLELKMNKYNNRFENKYNVDDFYDDDDGDVMVRLTAMLMKQSKRFSCFVIIIE